MLNSRIRPRWTRALSLLLALILWLAGAALPVSAEPSYPKPTDYIADDAAVLSEATVKLIREQNAALLSQAEAMIAVCTVKSTDGVDIGKYARSVYTEWELPAGVLILVASDDNAFFLVQSAGISDKITNETLERIRDVEIEADFAAGNIDRAVRSAVSKLSILMLSELKKEKAPAAEGTAAENGEASAPAGKSLLGRIWGVIKVLLIIALVLLLLFAGLFVAALFNDDAAAFMRRYIFRKGGSSAPPPAYYDDRLYGSGRNPGQRPAGQRPDGQRRPQPGNRLPQQSNSARTPGGQGRNNPYGGQQYHNRQGGQQPYYPQSGGQQPYYPRQGQGGQPYNPQYRNPQAPRQQVPYDQMTTPVRQGQPPARQSRQNPTPQPYSAANDPALGLSADADGNATQTYTIPGRQNGR